MKKILSIIITLALVVGMMPFCWGAEGFSDVNAESIEGAAITKLYDAGVVNGFNDGLFHAERGLTRAQFCKMINKVFGFTEVGTETFKDVAATYWGATEISIAQKAGYIKGVGNGNFGPDRALTREQVCIMLVRIIQPEPIEFTGVITDAVSDWALDDVKTALAYYIFTLEDGGKFRAQQAITRGEVSVVLSRYLNSSTPIVKPDSEFVMAIKDLSRAFGTMEMTAVEKAVLNPLKACLDKAIAVADEGKVEVTEDYVKSTYANEIKKIGEAYNAMSEANASAMRAKISPIVSVKAAGVLYNLFLVESAPSSGGGGGGGGDTENNNPGDDNTGDTGNEGDNNNPGGENSGDNNNPGDGGNDDDNNHDEPPAPTPDRSEVVLAIEKVVSQITTMQEKDEYLFNSYELTVIEPLMDCLNDVLDDAAAGTKITKAYVKSEYGYYGGPIPTVKSAMKELENLEKRDPTKPYWTKLKTTLGKLDPDATTVLEEYFLND